MKKEIEIEVRPERLKDYEFIRKLIAKKLSVLKEEITAFKIIRRSIDARSKNPIFRVKNIVFLNEQFQDQKPIFKFQNVEKSQPVIIVGSGPAGLFAALKLLELNLKPIILERGKDVRTRRRDLKAIQQESKVNPESNYCFGEGGAGTYSDGKLYTRSKKRGDVNRILQLFIRHGASEDIAIDSHPHIGSNKLPNVVKEMRETILKYGGEFHFGSKVSDLIVRDSKIQGVIVNGNEEYLAKSVILAVGHSARDVYELFKKRGFYIEKKEFAMGVRIEHPQKIIDYIQYHSFERLPNLPAASYSLHCQTDGRGVYSFCMCPGGVIIPASTSNSEIVLNGMSTSRRDSPFANSGLVVTIKDEDLKEYEKFGDFAGLEFQRDFERKMFELTGSQIAPAQRVTDFLKGSISSSLGDTSYIPGIKSAPLHELLPENIAKRLQKSILFFDKSRKGLYSQEAIILAPESRTSAPVRIKRDKETLMHVQIEGLFPCGEGAGYAGGIVSAAIDGERCAEAAARFSRIPF